MKTTTILAVLLVTAAFAGCTADESTPTPATMTPSPTPAATPTANATPAIPTLTPPTGAPTPGAATSIAIVSFAENATASANTTVCWEIQGLGKVNHVAVHWDNESHPQENATFSMYDQGASYPGNMTSPDPAGYTLPGTFCTDVPVPATGTVYYRAHVIDAAGAPGKVSAERWTNATASA